MQPLKSYTKKPVTIQAIKFDGTALCAETIVGLTEGSKTPAFIDHSAETDGARLYIRTLEGNHTVSVGDFVIRGIAGEFYPCKPDIFAGSYDEAVADDFLGRLKVEYEELRQRINKLHNFIGTSPFNNLPPRAQRLLEQQINAMREYRDILSDRLKDLETTASPKSAAVPPSEPGGYIGDVYFGNGGVAGTHRWNGTSWDAIEETRTTARQDDKPGEELGDGVRMTGPDHSNDAPEFR